MEVTIKTSETLRLLELRGLEVYSCDGKYVLMLPRACSALGLDGRCTIYQNRPQDCREFAINCAMCKTARAVEDSKRKGGDRQQ